MLDRTNGKFISAHNFVTQTWNDGFDANGRPKVRPDSIPTPQGVPASPALGATNFQAPSYDRYNGLAFLAYQDAESIAVSADQPYEPGKLFYGRGDARGRAVSRPSAQGVMAWDPAKGQAVWKFPLTRGSLGAGVLATKGGLVFAGSGEGWLYALDEKTGRPLWRFYTGGGINASPISYAVDGRQYIAVSAGPGVISFALPQ
jgi:alcohol dehydrogenase (cytochrome c)